MRRFVMALLTCVALLALSGIGQAQSVASNPQLPAEILAGLISKYVAIAEQYNYLVEQGGNPDSAIELRLAASLDFSTLGVDLGADLAPIMMGISKIAFWVNANIFLRYPSTTRIDLSGSFGNIELLTTKTESILVSRDESVFSVLPQGGVGMPPEIPIETTPSASFEELQGIFALLLASLPNITMEYDGLKVTPEGMAHVVRLVPAEDGMIVTLWILDETWDLSKVEFVDIKGGINATLTIRRMELITSPLPDPTFEIDTSALAELPYDDLVTVLGLKLLSVLQSGVPVVADLYPSSAEVLQGNQITVISNGIDADDDESELTANIEYRSPDGAWTPLKANYVGASPFGSWQATFAPSLTDPVGKYSFRVTYTDTTGAVSEPLEFPDAVTVIPVPPYIVSVSPVHQEKLVPVSAQVLVTFSQEMDKASVESAFSLADPSGKSVSGSYEWSGASFTFKPDQDLSYGQTYLAKVLGTAMSVNMATLDADMDGVGEGSPADDFVWSFTTAPAPLPKVAKFEPADKQTDVPISTTVSVTFTESMDHQTVESAFSLVSTTGETVSGSFQWADNTLTFVPSESLKYNATYRAKVLGSAKSALGVGLDTNGNGIAEGSPADDLSWWFSVERFPVLSAKPEAKSALKGDIIAVYLTAQSVSQLDSFTFDVNFDPTVLKVLKVERESFLNWRPRPRVVQEADVWLPAVIDSENGLVRFSASKTRTGGVSGSGTIAIITFQAIGVGESPLKFQNATFTNVLGESLSPELQDSNIQVLDSSLWDANKDGVVDILDFITIQAKAGAPADVNGDGVVDILDIVAAMGGAKGSPALIPTTSGLGYCFPNPLNPETWIPYQLAKDADVVIRIYNAKGQLVKTLDLGYKSAGFYNTKSAAAHWDGTNESGERVASGVYFYSIKAGEFSAIRKMMVLD